MQERPRWREQMGPAGQGAGRAVMPAEDRAPPRLLPAQVAAWTVEKLSFTS